MDFYTLRDSIRNVIELYNYDKENGVDCSLEDYIAQFLINSDLVLEDIYEP